MWGDRHHPVSCTQVIGAVRHKVIPPRQRRFHAGCAGTGRKPVCKKANAKPGESLETMYPKSRLVAQGQDYLLYVFAFENSPQSELSSRSQQTCEAGLQTCPLPLPPAGAGKKHFSNRNVNGAITF